MPNIRRLVSGPLKREGHWSDALVVGGEAFVEAIQGRYRRRTQFTVAELDGGVWQVREEPLTYSTGKQS